MTLRRLLLPMFLLAGISVAQEVSAPVGPSYLLPVPATGNLVMLGSIATPSMSLSTTGLAGTSAVPQVMQVPEFAPPSTYAYLDNVYWGEHPPTPIFGNRVETPSMTPDETQWYMRAVETGGLEPSAPFPEKFDVTILEGAEVPAPTEFIELQGGPVPANLPASILNTGVTGEINHQWLLQRGYGVSLAEAAAYWKTHKPSAPRVFTNQNLKR